MAARTTAGATGGTGGVAGVHGADIAFGTGGVRVVGGTGPVADGVAGPARGRFHAETGGVAVSGGTEAGRLVEVEDRAVRDRLCAALRAGGAWTARQSDDGLYVRCMG